MISRNGTTPASLWQKRLTRRGLLQRGSTLAVASSLLPPCVVMAQRSLRGLGFEPLSASRDDALRVPPGYRADVLLRWGDALFTGVPQLEPSSVAEGGLLGARAARAQSGQVGYNCDGLGLFDIGDGELLVCVNHEYPNPELLFPGYRAALRSRRADAYIRANPSAVAFMQAAVGMSIVHVEARPDWRLRRDSPFNRRITATTPMSLTGPARGHELFRTRLDPTGTRVAGTLQNCAGGVTPWGTYLSAEENVDDCFGNRRGARLDRAEALAHTRLRPRGGQGRFRWEFADPRFDVAVHPREPFKQGWIVEVDPRDPSRPIKKRTALGRFKHEGATSVVAPDGRVVVYMGDDEPFEYLYKFVTANVFDPERPEANMDLLDEGTLYVARFAEDGSGEWAPLVWDEERALSPATGFHSQGDVVLRCREAADRLGATPMDRPEDIAVNPLTRKVYVACTQNAERQGGEVEAAGRTVSAEPDRLNPRAPNPWGHIVELTEAGNDPTATRFDWEIFLLAGDPQAGGLMSALAADRALRADETYFGGHPDPGELSVIAAPDNLTFDAQGNLWITTDGAQPRGHNNGCYVCPTAGESRGVVTRFLSGPVGCEVCGCEITADGRSLFLSIQHPGEGGTAEAPISAWPDGGGAAPRPSVVVVRREDATRGLLD